MNEAARPDSGRSAQFAPILPLTVAAFLWSTAAPAHMAAEGVVKERMDLMSNMGRAMKALSVEARGDGAFDGSGPAAIAEKLDRHANRIAELFPKGSGRPPSEAKPEIWTDWQRFRQTAASLTDETAKLARVARDGDRASFIAQLRAVGQACSACHKDFRAKRKGH